jgi:hypothetical protein
MSDWRNDPDEIRRAQIWDEVDGDGLLYLQRLDAEGLWHPSFRPLPEPREVRNVPITPP